MSGLLALLDDVAAIAKVAASSLDDIAAQATKAGTKAAALVIDDAAVTPQYTHGFEPSRELPIVWRIAKGSVKNKLLILLPAGLLLSSFAPWAITPLLMIGGGYLCYEGAEKVLHKYLRHSGSKAEDKPSDPAHLEETKVAGAIKTDFILSAEIMTVSLAAIPESNIWMEGTVLAVVGVGITALVYGGVALIVKADDLGLLMARSGRLKPTRAMGRWIVRSMPAFMHGLTIVGTVAMLWVGGSIIVHGLEVLRFIWLGHLIQGWAVAVGGLVPWGAAAVEWAVTAVADGVLGVAIGAAIIPLVSKVITPVLSIFAKKKP
ncbi:MAG: DUF808 domain-containing protein [Paracoccaceae bacterium]